MKFGKKIAATLLGIVCAGCLAGGLTACKTKGPTGTPDNATTIRLALPNDGSAPTAHTGIENIGYMAYALDKQDYYHVYAYGTAKSMGYTQTTQTWKDYKDGVMICSDITYSTFVKAGTQSCFVNNEAYMRTSETPAKNTNSTSAKWKTNKPTYYDRNGYLTAYGEFSTELSVYIINEETINSYGEVIKNSDGTYSQSFSLNSNAAYYYQYGMKTRGSLKGYPAFKSINITFTFDSNWTVLSSECDELAEIAPGALGGISMDSTSKVTTTYSYGEDEFDEVHYGYYDNYFKQYVGQIDGNNKGEENEVTVLDVLGSAFAGVITEGEQFGLELNIGNTEYDGKIYLSLSDLSDVLGSIDARLALGLKDSGKQDLYLDFAGGTVNAYYSDDFAMTLNVDAVSTIISQFSEYISKFSQNGGASAVSYSLTEEDDDEGGLNLTELMTMLKLESDDSSATVSVETDNLLGTGIGVRLYIYCLRDGDTFVFDYFELESITYDSTSIDLYAKITPDKSGEIISHNKADAPANLADYASGIYSMLDSDTLKVSLDFDGAKQNVIGMLQGLNVKATAYVELGYDLATRVDLVAEYAGISAELAIYYGNNISFKNAGEIYLDLVKVNGVEIGAKVYCNISDTVDAVKNLLDLINNNVAPASLTSAQSEEAANSVATIINGILNLNFGEVLGDIYASNSQIRVSADIDAVVGALGVNVNGVKFGTAALALGLENGKANLSLSLEALGFAMTVEGSGEQLTLPEKSDYLDAVELVELVSAAVNETQIIIGAQSIAFDIDALVIIDDVPMNIRGTGEVSWADGLKIAVDAVMTVADGTSASAKDEVALKLYFDSAAAEGEPFIRFAVNQLGMEIYDKDISDTQSGLQKIIDSVNLLINGEKSGNASAEAAAELYNTSVALDGANVGTAVEQVISSDNVQKILGAVLGFVKDLSISTGRDVDDNSVTSLLISHALYGNLTLSAKGGLSLDADITDGNGTQILTVSAGVSAGNGSAFESVNTALDGCEMFSTAETGEAFVKIVYNYLFAVIEEGVSVSQTLGSNTYEVSIHLDGAKSGIPALKDVSADAVLYYTQGLVGDKIKGDKLAEIDLAMNIGSTEVQANVRYNDEKIYISLDKIGTTVLNEVKFYASKDDIYSAVEELVRIITDESVITTLSKLLGSSDNNTAEVYAVSAQADDGAITDLITKIISFDFAGTFSYASVDGVNTATVNVDKLLALFGADLGFEIGTAGISVNPVTHTVSGNISLGGREWVSLTAEKAARRIYADNWQSAYTNAGFVTTLISDMYKTVTNDDGEFYSLYTFSGKVDIAIKISIGISINKTIELNVTSLTAGVDESGEFYLTILADLKSCSAAGMTIAAANRISITYSGGYVTLGKGVGADGAVYKVMTLDYLLQNAFAKHSGDVDSPIRWLLGMSDTVWNAVAGYIPSLVSNGTPTYTLYNSLAQASSNSVFYLSKILSGFAINVNGETVTEFGNGTAAATALGITENYYAFELNAKSVTGGVLDNLYLALLRNDEQGISGIKAKGSLSASPATITFNVDLNEYKEGVTELYESGDITGEQAAPNYFAVVTNSYDIDFDRQFTSSDSHIAPVFGCYTTGASNPYESVNEYSKVTLTVAYGDHLVTAYEALGLPLNENGVYFAADDISYSSIVYLRTPFAPTWVNDEHTYKIIYTTDKEGNNRITDEDDGRIYIQLWGDTTIYAQVEESVKVNFVTGVDGVGTVTGGFVGDAELIEYVIGGYEFRGWYADGNYTVKVENANDGNIQKVDGVLTVYGKYVLASITVNGVVYNYTDNAYTVAGFDEYGIKPYTEFGSTLILESSVNGYPVTSISANALKGSMVKNVIVPESITEVGAQAFMDNYAIESVVFTADTVKLYGNSASGDNRYVFFGCSTADGGNSTKLNLYYNEIVGEGDWTTFRSGKRIGTDAGGTLNAKGTWTYVNFVQQGAVLSHNLTCLENGIKFLGKTAEQIKAEIIAELNENSAAKGYINAYTVSVDSPLTMNSKLNTVTVTVEKATPYYLLTINSNRSGAIVKGDVEVYNGERYVKAGSAVTVNPPEGFEFVSLTGIEHNGNTFLMPNSSLTLEAVCEETKITEYTLNSAVSFVLEGVEYSGGATFTVEEGSSLGVPAADGYLFLGWAYNNGKELEFVSGETIEYSNYYAIWAYARDEITSVSVVTEGSDPNASGVVWNASLAAGFEGWYTSDDFMTKVTSLSSYEPLYARVYFTISINYSLKSNMYIFFNTVDESEKQVESSSKSYTGTVTALEGITVTLNDKQKDGKAYSLYHGTTLLVGDIRVKNRKAIIGTEGNTQVMTCNLAMGAIDV
ncbi:MAG: hypothetical protein K2J83_07925, partial [Clostridia bacterium]|nr:hypothetical protein [Clostridia bacterium]